MDNSISDNRTRPKLYTLENVLIIDFIKAIDNKDYKFIGEDCTETNFNNLYIDYIEAVKDTSKQTGTHKRIEALEKEYFIVLKLVVFLNHTYSRGIIDILNNDFNYNIPDKYTDDDIKYVLDKNALILDRVKLMRYKLPTEPKVKKTDKENTIYDIVTNLSLAAGYDLDYDKLTIIKFVSYIKALRNRENE